MGFQHNCQSDCVIEGNSGGAQGGRKAFTVSSHSRQCLLGPLDIQMWRMETRLASFWIWRACLVMLQALSVSEDRC